MFYAQVNPEGSYQGEQLKSKENVQIGLCIQQKHQGVALVHSC